MSFNVIISDIELNESDSKKIPINNPTSYCSRGGLEQFSVFFCIKYADIDTLFFMYQLRVPDNFRERNESIPDTRYPTHLQGMSHKAARLTDKKINKNAIE